MMSSARVSRLARGLLVAFTIAACSWAGIHTSAMAAGTEVPCTVANVAPLESGRTSRIDLNCDLNGRGSEADRLTIIERAANRPPAASWPDIVDVKNAVWLFDYHGDSNVELIINFRSAGQALIAEVYDAQGDPGRLDYTLNNGQLNFKNRIAPTVRVVAPDGWWIRDGLINFNLDIAVDGLVDAAFAVRNTLTNRVETDGNIDFAISIRDTDRDGRPDYDWRTLKYPRTLQAYTLPRTFLMVNAQDNEAPLAPILPWPYLGGETYGYLTASAHQKSQPPIQVDWDSGTISAVGEFVSSRGNDAQWFVYSFEEVQPGQLSSPDFESPFAWYDLAQDHDRQSELAIRFGYYWPEDPVFVKGRFTDPLNFVRYSWDQDNDGYWDYKLGLLGTNEVTSTVSVGNLMMQLVPYSQLPDWVTARDWGVATFVAPEGVHAQGEGIYEWDPSPWLTEQYFTGYSESPVPPLEAKVDPREDLRDIQPGFRGEYQLQLGNKVSLYISSIDHKLHLLRATQGLWKIDDRSELRYANLDGDRYLDEWRYLVDGQLRSQLNLAHGYLVYSEGDQVRIKRVQAHPAIVELGPPRDHSQWLALGEYLKASRSFAPGDLQAMQSQFEGTPVHIAKATLRDFRPDSNGFRFVLELQPGFQADSFSQLDLRKLQPGTYVVTYDGKFSVVPLTPPKLSLTVQLPADAGLGVSRPIPIRIQVVNLGSEDAKNLTLVAEVRRDAAPIEIDRQPVDILSRKPTEVMLTWQPVLTGSWQLDVRLEGSGGNVVVQRSEPLTVRASQESDIAAILSDSTSGRHRLPAFIVLVTLAVMATLAARSIRIYARMGTKQ